MLTARAVLPAPLAVPAPFPAGIRQFAELVASLVEILERQAAAIEKVKLKAIGRRNLVDAEPERRSWPPW